MRVLHDQSFQCQFWHQWWYSTTMEYFHCGLLFINIELVYQNNFCYEWYEITIILSFTCCSTTALCFIFLCKRQEKGVTVVTLLFLFRAIHSRSCLGKRIQYLETKLLDGIIPLSWNTTIVQKRSFVNLFDYTIYKHVNDFALILFYCLWCHNKW